MRELPYRQVHLDFHNSPLIDDIAADFDPQKFAATMANAHVQSVAVFSKCHHGMTYHPTVVGKMHPSLQRDLLGEMIEALHGRGIRAVAYLSVGFDEHAAQNHADWRQVEESGRLAGRGPLDSVGWTFMCMGSPYLDYLLDQTREVVSSYPADGVFFDIVGQVEPGCLCAHCLRRLEAEGTDPNDSSALAASSLRMVRDGMDRLSAAAWAALPEASVFFNSRLRIDEVPQRGVRPEMKYQTHIEIESLPTGGWGYQHFPTFARYFQTYDTVLSGQTARFHGAWSDFGTLKSRAALAYETSLMLALGARCGVGDQMHPRGTLDPAAYELIGEIFAEVEAKQPWCAGAVPVVDVGLLVVGDRDNTGSPVSGWSTLAAAQRALREEGFLFQIVDRDSDWTPYQALVLPDFVRLDAALSEKLGAYLRGGGKVLATYLSGLREDEDVFGLDGLSIEVLGELPRRRQPEFLEVEYLDLDPSLSSGLPEEAFVTFGLGVHVSSGSSRLLGRIGEPYFQRSRATYSGHRQAPLARWTEHPVGVRTDNVLYLAHDLFSQYGRHAVTAHRRVVGNALRTLLGGTRVSTSLPSAATVVLTRQPGRWVLHLLHAAAERRGDLEIIEDQLELRDVRVALSLPFRPSSVHLEPAHERLQVTESKGVVRCTVPVVRGHQMVVFSEG